MGFSKMRRRIAGSATCSCTSAENARAVSSRATCSIPGATPSAAATVSGTAAGTALRAPPRASARPGAGSIVVTSGIMPRRAARAATAAALVVLPTPPGPTHTTIFLPARKSLTSRSPDLHQQDRDVVRTARVVRGVDQQVATHLEIRHRVQDLRDDVVFDRTP